MTRVLVLGVLSLLFAACTQTVENVSAGSDDGVEMMRVVRDPGYVEDLAWRYLYLEVDEDGTRAINEEIEALDPDEMRVMARELQSLQGADEYEAEMGDRLTELAISRGVGMFDLNEDDLRTINDQIGYSWPSVDRDPGEIRTLGICLPGYESCTVWSPGSTFSLYAFNSMSPGTTASSSDR